MQHCHDKTIQQPVQIRRAAGRGNYDTSGRTPARKATHATLRPADRTIYAAVTAMRSAIGLRDQLSAFATQTGQEAPLPPTPQQPYGVLSVGQEPLVAG
jgi:hypothetical protein